MKRKATQIALEGHFRIVAIRPDGTERLLADWSKNLILDAGLNRLGSGGAWDLCRVGSGSTAPATSQTALEAQVAETSNIQSQIGGTAVDNTYSWARRVYRFTAGVAAGNLSEIGVGWYGGQFSRALIKDEMGDPTTITVLSDEVLDVTYEVRAYPNTEDQEYTVNISGVDYDFVVRPVGVTGDFSTSGWANSVYTLMTAGVTGLSGNALSMVPYGTDFALVPHSSSMPSGTQLVSGSSSTPSYRTAYSTNSLKRDCRIAFGLDQGTVPFGGFWFMTACGFYQASVSPPIPKDGTKTFELDFELSWARH